MKQNLSIPDVLRCATQSRFNQLVLEHLSAAQPLAAGPRTMPNEAKAFASTQAAWRFYHNPRYSMPIIARPLLEAAREAVHEECQEFVLAVHDWSHIHLDHENKKDRIELGNGHDLGYELQACLLVGDRNGKPLAPVYLGVEAADGVHSTKHGTPKPPLSQLDSLKPVMMDVQQMELGKLVIHLIDAEADSVFHYRSWSEEKDFFYLVRADDRLAMHDDQEKKFSEIHQQLLGQNAFSFSREVSYHDKPAVQFVAETTIILTRPAHQNRKGKPRKTIPGPPITLRLIISEVRDAQGKVLAVWYLLTNAPLWVTAATIALWYYWRWRIESYFKLLKSAGQQLEHWLQETAEAFARRLVVASMACVLVWRLARSESPHAAKLRKVLVRLSGRQMRRGKEFTEPALLAGLWVLLSMLSLLENHDPEELRQWLYDSLRSGRGPPHDASKKV